MYKACALVLSTISIRPDRKPATEKDLCCSETLVRGILSLQNAVHLRTLEAPADFTTLVLSIK